MYLASLLCSGKILMGVSFLGLVWELFYKFSFSLTKVDKGHQNIGQKMTQDKMNKCKIAPKPNSKMKLPSISGKVFGW